VTSVLDVQTGTGNALADQPVELPATTVATDAWRPSVERAHHRLNARGAHVVEATDDLPFTDESFDLVISRHPIDTDYAEIARVLRPGGTYLALLLFPWVMRGRVGVVGRCRGRAWRAR
jgi:ubiquinone/menaquinone biosynthesis C-methylase UbiE